jgi:hypothetical protein
VELNRENIEDLKRRYGYTENEAEAAYYLWKVWARFTKMHKDEAEEREWTIDDLAEGDYVDPFGRKRYCRRPGRCNAGRRFDELFFGGDKGQPGFLKP